MRELVKDVIDFLRDWTELIGWLVLIIVVVGLAKIADWLDKL